MFKAIKALQIIALVTFSLHAAVAQDQPIDEEDVSTDSTEESTQLDYAIPTDVGGSGEWSIGEKIANVFIEAPISALIAALIGIFIVPILQNLAYRSRISKIFSGVRIPKGHRKNSIMMLGLGGSGKTTLSRRICGDMAQEPSKETNEFTLFEGAGMNNDQKYDYYISDYIGQDVGSLVSGFIKQQLTERSPFRFGDVNALILVVDIVDPDDELDDIPADQHPKIKEPNADRILENLTQWNRTALDAIFGMHTVDSLRYVCLFVNKKDRLASWNSSTAEKIRKSYKPLADDLSRRCFYEDERSATQQYAIFDIVIGSAAEDIPVQLINNLQLMSVPLSENAMTLGRTNGGSA